jgi:hypothetical protein
MYPNLEDHELLANDRNGLGLPGGVGRCGGATIGSDMVDVRRGCRGFWS